MLWFFFWFLFEQINFFWSVISGSLRSFPFRLWRLSLLPSSSKHSKSFFPSCTDSFEISTCSWSSSFDLRCGPCRYRRNRACLDRSRCWLRCDLRLRLGNWCRNSWLRSLNWDFRRSRSSISLLLCYKWRKRLLRGWSRSGLFLLVLEEWIVSNAPESNPSKYLWAFCFRMGYESSWFLLHGFRVLSV